MIENVFDGAAELRTKITGAFVVGTELLFEGFPFDESRMIDVRGAVSEPGVQVDGEGGMTKVVDDLGFEGND